MRTPVCEDTCLLGHLFLETHLLPVTTSQGQKAGMVYGRGNGASGDSSGVTALVFMPVPTLHG